MIVGAHVIVYSKDAEADRVFSRDVLGYKSVDGGAMVKDLQAGFLEATGPSTATGNPQLPIKGGHCQREFCF